MTVLSRATQKANVRLPRLMYRAQNKYFSSPTTLVTYQMTVGSVAAELFIHYEKM